MPYQKSHEVEEYEADCFDVRRAYQVARPTLTLYPPDAPAVDSLVLILPGGGYEVEAVYHEGYEIAEALSRRGVGAAVLKYRLPGPRTATDASVNRSEDPRENPDFSVLIYGVTRLTGENRSWLEETLFHREMTPEELAAYRFLDRVDGRT